MKNIHAICLLFPFFFVFTIILFSPLSIKKLMLIQMVQTLIPILINSNQEIILPLQN